MGQDVSCPCQNNDSNVYYTDDEQPVATVVGLRVPTSPVVKTIDSSNAYSEPPQTPLPEGKSRKWEAMLPKDAGGPSGMDSSASSTQLPGEDAMGDSGSHTSRDDMGNATQGEVAFPDKRTLPEQEQFYSAAAGPDDAAQSRPEELPAALEVESEAARAARKKQEAHNDRIVATFNSVMLADGLKVLKHHRRSSKKPASRVIRYVPDYGGALVWDKPLRQPGAKASRVPLDAINQVELENRIVWISAGDERVGFETSKTEDADLMYQAICILVDRCHA